MIDHEHNLEQMIENEHAEQLKEMGPHHFDQYGIDIFEYRDQRLWEIDEAVDVVHGLPDKEEIFDMPAECNAEIIHVHENNPRIIKYLDGE